MKKNVNKNEITEMLILIVQISITMLVPIFLCMLGLGWFGGKIGIKWLSVIGFLLGAIAGFQNVFRLVKKYLNKKQ